MASVTIQWAGGENQFDLMIEQIRGLQQVTDKGPEQLFNALRLGTWLADDVIQIIRWGLIGGGVEPSEATRMAMNVFELHSLLEIKVTALEVMTHAMIGDLADEVDEAPGKPESPQGNGTLEASMEPGL